MAAFGREHHRPLVIEPDRTDAEPGTRSQQAVSAMRTLVPPTSATSPKPS
jgi:hypothetical protein